MTDQVLDILKLALLGLLYLFFARVLWAVWSEVRAPEARSAVEPYPQVAAAQPAPATAAAAPMPPRGRGGRPRRLVVLEPKERSGAAFAIDGVVGIGREADNTIIITDDAYISGHHARVWVSDQHVVIDDRGSKNGTYLNGNRLDQQRTINVGDRIQVGYTVLEAQ